VTLLDPLLHRTQQAVQLQQSPLAQSTTQNIRPAGAIATGTTLSDPRLSLVLLYTQTQTDTITVLITNSKCFYKHASVLDGDSTSSSALSRC